MAEEVNARTMRSKSTRTILVKAIEVDTDESMSMALPFTIAREAVE